MNKTVVLNGSPKPKYSASGYFIGQIEKIMGKELSVYQATKLIVPENASEMIEDILKADTLLIVFPLYIDSLPAPLVKALMLIEKGAKACPGEQLPMVYAICNCGFFEADNNRLALDIIKNFCVSSGLGWGYGIGIGAGGFVSSHSKESFGGPMTKINAAFGELVKSMASHSKREQNLLLTPFIPRSLYLYGANKAWEQAAEKYGQRNALRARPHAEDG